MLKQLKKTTHGAPMVEIDDAPKEIRMTAKDKKAWDKDGTTDVNFFKRWEWVLDEMIWAFTQVNADWEIKFASGKADHRFQPLDKDGNEIGKPLKLSDRKDVKEAVSYRMVNGPKHTYKIDYEGRDKHWKRMSNGFRLFGKYFNNLWD